VGHPKIVLDHCHDTGGFRGWLCDPCNVVLGMVKDRPEILRDLADYLERVTNKWPEAEKPVFICPTNIGLKSETAESSDV
jgi:hypothetical protein